MCIRDRDRVKTGISFVPQTRNVFADLTVRENLEDVPSLTDIPVQEVLKSLEKPYFQMKKTLEQMKGLNGLLLGLMTMTRAF